MKKTMTFFLLTACMAWCAPLFQEKFAQGLEGWRCAQQEDGQVVLHKATVVDGQSCLEITGDQDNSKNPFVILHKQLPALEDKATYRVSFRFKTQVTPDIKKQLRIRLQQYDAKGKNLSGGSDIFFYDKEGWRNFDCAFKSAAGATKSYLYIETSNLKSTDRVWLTDLAMEKTMDNDRGLLINGGFELGLAPWMSFQQRGGWRQLYTMSPDTPFGKRCLDITGDPENLSNRLVILNQQLTTFEPDTEYLLSFQFRCLVKEKSKGKLFYAHVQQLDAKGGRLKGYEAHLPLDSDLWTYRQLTFTTLPNTAKVAIHFCTAELRPEDHIFLDEVTVEKAQTPGAPFDAKKAIATAGLTKLAGKPGVAQIDPKTGLLASLELAGQSVIPAAENASVIYASSKGTEEMLSGKGTPGKSFPFRATVKYTWEGDELREIVNIEATADAHGPFKIGVRHGAQTGVWDNIICGLFPVRVIPFDKSTVFTYGNAPNDLNLTQLDLYQGYIMPLLVLEGEDSYLSIASHSYDDAVTFRPNIPQGYVSAVERNPLSVKKGDTFRFELNWRLFDRKTSVLRDVWRAAILTMRSEHPMLKDYIPVHDPGPRTVVPGPLGAVTGFKESRVRRLYPHSAIWQSWHDDVYEDFPTTGSWWNGSTEYREKLTPEKVKAHFDDLKARGFYVISYSRTFCNLELAGKQYPENWLRNAPGGGVQLYGGGYRRQFPKHVQEDTGFKEIVWGMFDTFQPGCLDFLINRFTKVIDTYHPWAIGWDCAGFGPEDFLMVASFTEKLRKSGNPTRIVGNECIGPITAYLDWTIIENGFVGGKTPYDYEVIRALPLPVVCLERFNLAEAAVQNYLNGKRTWLWKSGLDWTKRYLACLLSQQPDLREKPKTLEHHVQVTWYLKDLSLGASAGVPEEAKPTPEPLIRMGDVNSIIRMDKSYALRFPNNRESDGPLTACAWADAKSGHFRLAGYNEAAEPKDFRLRLDPAAFAEQGWSTSQIQNCEAFLVTPDGHTSIKPVFKDNGGMLELQCTLPAYTAIHLFAEQPPATKEN